MRAAEFARFCSWCSWQRPWTWVQHCCAIPASIAGPGSPRAAAVDLNRLDTLLEGADLPSDDEEDEDYQ